MSTSELSLVEVLASYPPEKREELLGAMSEEEQFAMLYSWECWRRPKQATPPGDWRVWVILAGRGFGKTRTGAEFVREQVEANRAGHIALVGATASDVRDTMIEGESGLLSIFPPNQRPRYEPSKRRVTFSNGAIAVAFSADEPDRLRGPNHDLAWADELAAWRYPDAWDQLMLGLRIGDLPRSVVTTTPRPVPVLRRLLKSDDGTVVITRGSTYENSNNLAGAFLTEMKRRYEGTRLGRQELLAELLEDVEGALWNRDVFDLDRVNKAPDLVRIVVAIDPAVTSHETSNETGIIVAGVGIDGHGYVLDDYSVRGTPTEWASAAIKAFKYYNADRIVVEANQGGDMVTHTLRTVDKNVPLRAVHASRGKRTRAEPVAALYEQHRIHHVGLLSTLEDQMASWVPDESPSPDRLDALVWAFTDLMIDAKQAPAVVPFSMEQESHWRM